MMRIGQLPQPQAVYKQLDYVGRFRTQYLHHEPWAFYQAAQFARADLFAQPAHVGPPVGGLINMTADLKFLCKGIIAGVASFYFEISDTRWAGRNVMTLAALTDAAYPLPRTVAGYVAAGVTPWRFGGALLAAEWLVGRASNAMASSSVLDALASNGLLGCGLELAPMALGNALARHQHGHLAYVCYWGACLGRALLLPARSCVAAIASVNAAFWISVGSTVATVLLAAYLAAAVYWRPEVLGDRHLSRGIDPHSSGRPLATQQTLTRLRTAYGRLDPARIKQDGARLAEQLPAFVQQLEALDALPNRARSGETWSQVIEKASRVLQSPQARFLLPLEGDATIAAWDVAGFVWFLLEHGELENKADKARATHARWTQKISFVQNLAECIGVCATRQAQHLLLPIQGLVGHFCIEESRVRNRPDVDGFIQMHLSTFQQREGAPLERNDAINRGRDMLQETHRCYQTHPQDREKVLSALREFLRLTYDDLVLEDLN